MISPLNESIAKVFIGLGVPLVQGYGLTETSSLVTLNVGPDYAARPESVGPLLPVCEVRVVDAEGVEAGMVMAAVPGSLAALDHAAARYGTRSLGELIEPAGRTPRA